MSTLKNLLHNIFAPSAYHQGRRFYNNKQWLQALESFQAAAQSHPKHPQSNFKLGLCHMKLGHLAEAHSYIETALKLAPYNTQWQTQLKQSERKLEQTHHAAHASPAQTAAPVNLSTLPPRIQQGGTTDTIGISLKKKLLLVPSDYNHRALSDIMPFVAHYADDFDVYIIVREAKFDLERKQGYTLVKNGTSYGEFLKFTADYVIDAGTMNFGYRISDEPTWVSVWHGIPYKKMFVDMDIKNLPGALRYGLAYNSMISMSDFYTNTFLRGAMRYDGVVHQLGSAKIDKLLNSEPTKTDNIKKSLGLSLDSKVILYAPEFRAKGEITLPFDAAKLLSQFNSDYHLVVWLDEDNTLLIEQPDDSNVPTIVSTSDLNRIQALMLADILISDYRTRLIEMFHNHNKPVVLYQYDYGDFISSHPNRESEVEKLALLPYSYTRAHQLYQLDLQTLTPESLSRLSETSTTSTLLKQSLGIPLDKKVVLYAPTFRERGAVALPFNPERLLDALNGRLQSSSEQDSAILEQQTKKQPESDYVIITKLHYLNTLKDSHPAVIDCTEYGEITDLMKIADILISDYSSLVLDFALLNKPIVLFQYDHFKYMNERGVYFDFEDYLPTRQIIDREIDLYRLDWSTLEGNNQKIINTFYPLEDGNATKRIVDTLAFTPATRHSKDLIFLVNDLNQIGGVHSFVHNMAKYYKQRYNSRVYLLAIKEFAELNSEFHIFDSPYVDFKLSSQFLGGGCANILQNTDGVVISLQFSAHLHFQKYLYNAKTVLMFHGDVKDMISGDLYAPHLGWLNNGDLFNYDKFLLLTHSNQNLIAPHLNEKVQSKLGYIHNSIDEVYTPLPKADKQAVAVISRLDADKNVFALIDLGKELRRTATDYVVNIYGDGELKTALQSEIDANGLSDYLKIRGFEADKAKIFGENNALLLLSKSEGLPLVVLEAYAHGRPVIAFNSFTSASEIILHQKTGYLSEYGDYAAVVRHLSQLDNIASADIKELFHEYENDEVFDHWNALFSELDALYATQK